MTTTLQNDPERDGVAAVGSPVDRRVRRLQRKLEKRNQRIAGLERRIAKLETSLALRSGDAVVVDFTKLQRNIAQAVTEALCNVRMIPVLGIGGHRKIVEVRTSDA
jgi:predicted RNase H-like nuclease (RuvC/YqgF family)